MKGYDVYQNLLHLYSHTKVYIFVNCYCLTKSKLLSLIYGIIKHMRHIFIPPCLMKWFPNLNSISYLTITQVSKISPKKDVAHNIIVV